MKKELIAAGCMSLVLLAGAQVFAQKKGDAAKGKATFEENCSVCHNADSEERKVGPGLKGLFKRDKLVNGKAVNEANVRALINAGGNGMPSYADLISDGEKNDIVAYLQTL
jgi:mono/diheme cytochrome c family protein